MQRVAAILVMAMLCACSSGTGATGESGSQGLKGDKGDRGEQGPAGEKGDKGDKGDPGSSGGGSASSGSRIKLRVATGADGSRQVLANWWDSTLNTECYFQVASDGVERCVPTSLSSQYFTDSNCTQPIVLWSNCTTLPAYVTLTDIDKSCSSAPKTRYLVYPVGPQVSEPASLYYRYTTDCSPTSKPAAMNYYQRGTEVPSTDFVSRTISVQ